MIKNAPRPDICQDCWPSGDPAHGRQLTLLFGDFRARRRWRAAVTGDPEKRIRDHMKETPQVKLMDKVSLLTFVGFKNFPRKERSWFFISTVTV